MMTKEKFSRFPMGHRNRSGVPVLSNTPVGVMDIRGVRDYIVSGIAKERQEHLQGMLQALCDHKVAQQYKLLSFEYVTFYGTFSYRNSQGLTERSGMFVLDVDGLKGAEEVLRVRDIFIHDARVESRLVFTSPSGVGVKAVVTLRDEWGATLKEQFQWLSRYFLFEYGIGIDQSGSDICRPCYLPYDPDCYLNPKFSN